MKGRKDFMRVQRVKEAFLRILELGKLFRSFNTLLKPWRLLALAGCCSSQASTVR